MLLIATIAAGIALLGPLTYFALRYLSATRQDIEFAIPQDGVVALQLDIHGDRVRTLRIFYSDGTWTEVRELRSLCRQDRRRPSIAGGISAQHAQSQRAT